MNLIKSIVLNEFAANPPNLVYLKTEKKNAKITICMSLIVTLGIVIYTTQLTGDIIQERY